MKSVETFRFAWMKEDYYQLYEASDPAFKEKVTYEQFTQFMHSMRNKLGEIRASSSVGEEVTYTTTGTLVVLTYSTEFTKGKASEQFAWIIKEDRSSLYNYTINVEIQWDQR
jgi:hypothetical protein